MAAANGRERASLGTGEVDHLLHDAQNQLGACGDGQLLEKAVQMRVDGVFRNLETHGNAPLLETVKDALDNLQLTLREAQSFGNFKPSLLAEE